MNKIERLTLAMSFFALAFSMISVGLNAFWIAGARFAEGISFLLGIISGIAMIIFTILGILILSGYGKE